MSNELKEDFLSRDQKIPGQNFVCLSFVSPEKVLEDKHLYYMWHYERHLQQKIEELNGKLKEALNKSETEIEVNVPEPCSFKQFKEMFLDFEYSKHTVIEKEFYELNDFKTTVRGLKIRGVYETQKEADFRAKQLRSSDSSHHVFRGDVGAWLPWDPNPDDINEQDYANDQLNTLMKKKKENELKKNIHWEEEKRQKMEAMQRENLLRDEANKKRQLEDAETATETTGGGGSKEDVDNAAVVEVVESSGGGGSKEDVVDASGSGGSKVSEDIKAGLQSDDPWLQRKLLDEASNAQVDDALNNTINKLSTSDA